MTYPYGQFNNFNFQPMMNQSLGTAMQFPTLQALGFPMYNQSLFTGMNFGYPSNSFNNYNMFNTGAVGYNFQPQFNFSTSISDSAPTSTSVAATNPSVKQEVQPISAESQNQKNEIEQGLKEAKEQLVQMEAAKKEDGSATIKQNAEIDERKCEEVSMTEKALGFLGNAMSGVGNVLKQAVGFEEDGSWNWKKCAVNAAIAVGVTAAVVCAGPIGAGVAAAAGAVGIGAGTAAAIGAGTTFVLGTAVPNILAAAGVGFGSVKAYDGAKGIYNAKTMDELNKAEQDLAAGVFVAGVSAVGLKNAVASANETVAANTATASSNTATNAATKAGLTEKLFTNQWKAAKINFNESAAEMQAAGGGFKGFVSSSSNQFKNMFQKPAESAEAKFNSERQSVIDKFEQQISDIEARITSPTATAQEKALLKLEQNNLKEALTTVNDAKTMHQWRTITDANKSYSKSMSELLKTLNKDGKVDIHGVEFNANNKAELEAVIKSIQKSNNTTGFFKKGFNSATRNSSKTIADELVSLKNGRFNSMSKMARSGKYETEANEFGYYHNIIGQAKNFAYNRWLSKYKPFPDFSLKAMLTKDYWTGFGSALKSYLSPKSALTAMDASFVATEPAWLLQSAMSNSGAMPMNIMASVHPIYEIEKGEELQLSPEEYQARYAQLTQGIQELESAYVQLGGKLDDINTNKS